MPYLLALTTPNSLLCSIALGSNSLEVGSQDDLSKRVATHLRGQINHLAIITPSPGQIAVNKQAIALFSHSDTVRADLLCPSSTGSVAVNAATHNSGHVVHPALMDSCFHLGAQLAAVGQENGAAGKAYVPVAIGAYLPLATAAPLSSAWAGAEIAQMMADGSATSKYFLRDLPAGPPKLALAGLQAKPAAAGLIQDASAALKVKASERSMLYEVLWQVSEAISEHPSSSRKEAKRWLDLDTRAPPVAFVLGPSKANYAASCMSDIATLQVTMAKTKAAGLSLHTAGVHPVGNSIARPSKLSNIIASSAAWGLIRVAATERPDLKWTAHDAHPAHAKVHNQHQLPGNDAFGTATYPGTQATPRLLSEHEQEQYIHGSFCTDGRTIVTGGLGGMGTIIDVLWSMALFRSSNVQSLSCKMMTCCIQLVLHLILSRWHTIAHKVDCASKLHCLRGVRSWSSAGVGSLVGGWLMSLGCANVCLLGRTGRLASMHGKAVPDIALSGNTSLTMARADLGCIEEMESIAWRDTAAFVRGIIHAGTRHASY